MSEADIDGTAARSATRANSHQVPMRADHPPHSGHPRPGAGGESVRSTDPPHSRHFGLGSLGSVGRGLVARAAPTPAINPTPAAIHTPAVMPVVIGQEMTMTIAHTHAPTDTRHHIPRLCTGLAFRSVGGLTSRRCTPDSTRPSQNS